MRWFSVTVSAIGLVMGIASSAWASDDKDTKAILDKALKALGGEEKLSKIKAFSWTAKGTIDFQGNEVEVTIQSVVQGSDHFRQEVEGEFSGNEFMGVTILAGNKGWRQQVGMEDIMELGKGALANQKRNLFIQLIPRMVHRLKEKGFKLKAAEEEKVDGKLAAGIKVTPPDGKDLTLYFDKESGLLVKLVAEAALVGDQPFDCEAIFSDYKEMKGIKQPTKVVYKRDGEKFLELEISEFKVLDKVDPKTFAPPE